MGCVTTGRVPVRHVATMRGWDHTKCGDEVPVDRKLDEARPDDYDALLLPGGVMNPDHLRMNAKAVSFAKAFATDGKPIAVICHSRSSPRGAIGAISPARRDGV